MRYCSVAEIAKKWNVSERSVRNYCAQRRVSGAFLTGKTWNIPENAEKPERINKRKEKPITLLDILKEQKASRYSGGIYAHTACHRGYLPRKRFFALPRIDRHLPSVRRSVYPPQARKQDSLFTRGIRYRFSFLDISQLVRRTSLLYLT